MNVGIEHFVVDSVVMLSIQNSWTIFFTCISTLGKLVSLIC